jgi:hypothetical protein
MVRALRGPMIMIAFLGSTAVAIIETIDRTVLMTVTRATAASALFV